jgi:hypothetical protein
VGREKRVNNGGCQLLRLAGCALALVCPGCPGAQRDLRLELESPEPVRRIHAIAESVDSRRMDLIPALIDRLDDDDPAVRLYAIVGLEKLTGTRLDYDYAADTGARRDAVSHWRDYAAALDAPARAGSRSESPGGAAP